MREGKGTIVTSESKPESLHVGCRRFAAEALAAAAAVACYANTLPNDFCFDDDLIVRQNPLVNEPARWLEVWTTDHWHGLAETSPYRDLLYRPVSLLSYRCVRMFGGPAPLPQHLANIVLHALAAAMVARMCRLVGGGDRAVMIAGLLFAVLPIHTEAVASVVGRADLLSTLGIIAAIAAHGRSSRVSPATSAMRWRVAAAAAAFIALGSKESGISVIPLVAMFDWYGHDPSDPRGGSARWCRWSTVWRLSYLLIPAALYLGLRYRALGGQLFPHAALTKTVNVLYDAPAWQHWLGVVQLWGMYWEKTFWPAVLSIKYSVNSVRLATGPWDTHVLLGLLAATLLLVVSLLEHRRGSRRATVLSLALAVAYAPTSNALVLMKVFFAERTWYLPSVFLTVLFGLVLATMVRGRRLWALCGLVAAAFAIRSGTRNADWRNNGTLYAAAVADQPQGAGALQLYGHWLVTQERYDEAIPLLHRAVDIDLGFTDAHRSLGEAYRRQGNLPSALRHLQIAEMQAPGVAGVKAALAEVAQRLASNDSELARLQAAVDAAPNDLAAVLALVRKQRNIGLLPEALARLEARDPAFTAEPVWHAEYAVTLVLLNRRDEAIERYERCLRIAPDDAQRAVELAMLLLERRVGRDLDRAWELSTRSLELSPDSPSVLACRAELLAARGDLSAAIEVYRRAIVRLVPDSPVRRNFEARVKTLGGQP